MEPKIQHMWVDFCDESDDEDEVASEFEQVEDDEWTEDDDLENMF